MIIVELGRTPMDMASGEKRAYGCDGGNEIKSGIQALSFGPDHHRSKSIRFCFLLTFLALQDWPWR